MKISNENCNPFGKCEVQSGRNKDFYCKEKGKTFHYINKSECFIVKIRVDECLIKGELERKCDFMLLNCDHKIAYLIELKGSDLEHTAKQILNVLNIFHKELSNFVEVHARIVLSKVYQRDIESEDYIKLKRKLKNRIKHKNILLSETI